MKSKVFKTRRKITLLNSKVSKTVYLKSCAPDLAAALRFKHIQKDNFLQIHKSETSRDNKF